jgi:hypothetical protein
VTSRRAFHWRNAIIPIVRAVAICVVALWCWALPASAQDVGDFDPASSDWNGLSDLVVLAGEGASVVRDLDAATLTSRDAVILIAPREAPPAEPLIAAMREGGRVVIADDYGAGGPILRAFHIERRAPHDTEDTLRLRGNPQLLVARPAMQHPLTMGVDALVTNHPQIVVHRPDASAADRAPLPPIFEIATGEAVVLAGAVGDEPHQGRLVVLSDPSVLINNMLEMRGNRRFAENLIAFVRRPEGRVLILPPDARIHGRFGESTLTDPLAGLRAVLDEINRASFPPAFLRVLAAGIAVVLLWLAVYVLPKVSPYGSASFATRPAAEGGFVGRVGWYSARAGDLTEPFLVYKFELETELHARLGLAGRASVNDVATAMEKRGLSPSEVQMARALLVELSRTQDVAERNAGDHPIGEARLAAFVQRGDALLARVGDKRRAA